MPDLVKLRNKSGTDLEVAFLHGRVVEAGATVDVAGRLAAEQPVDDAVHIAHPTGDPDEPERLLAWPTANWELVTDKKAGKPAGGKE